LASLVFDRLRCEAISPLLTMRSAILAFVCFLLSVAPASSQAWRGHSSKQSLRGDSVVSKANSKTTSAAHSATTPKATATTSNKAEILHSTKSNHNLEMVTKEIKVLEKAASSLSTTKKAASKATTHALKNSTITTHAASTNAPWAGHSKKSSTAKKTRTSEM
jgi:hypothetical protein